MDEKILNEYKNLEKEIISLNKEHMIFEFISNHRDIFDEIGQEIVNRIMSKDFYMVYQSHIKDDKCCGAEALFRLKIDDININPFAIFTIADYYKFEKLLTIKSLHKVCKYLKKIEDKVDDDFVLSFNLNPKLFDTEFCDMILEILTKHKIKNNHFAIELTEVSSLENIDINDMMRLKEYGIKIYCDDFGHGYTDKKALKLPFDVVKFVGKFVRDVDSKPENAQYIKNIVDICKKKGIDTIAENVETKHQADAIHKLGIKTIQGYYYSKPLTEENFIEKYSIKNF